MAPQKDNLFYHRLFWILVFVTVSLFVLIVRLFYLQVYQAPHYLTLSDKNRIHLSPLKPSRGLILDRNGLVLAKNRTQYHAVLDRRKAEPLDVCLPKLAKILNLSEEKLDEIRKASRETPLYIPLEIKKNLSWEELSILEVKNLFIPGVEVMTHQERFYPEGESLSHVVGYVAKPSQDSVAQNILLALPGVVEGKTGIEKYYEEELRGEFGQLETENNASGHRIRILSKVSSIPGETLSLTIDLNLQKYIYDLLKEHRRAAAIVMDVETGEILSMVSVPGYDPHLFVQGINRQGLAHLFNHPDGALTNKTVSGLYSPGSLIKVFMALNVLADDALGRSYQTDCQGKHKVGSHDFHCWRRYGHGALTLKKALIQSCDVFFYKVAQKLGIQKMAPFLAQFKLGALVGLDLPEEKTGLLPTPAWKRSRYNQAWYPGDTINLSIGQGATLTTPLQWVYAISLVANGGKLIQPHLKKEERAQKEEKLFLRQEDLKYVREALHQTVNTPGGTARLARVNHPKFQVSGKTSTSQVRRISKAERSEGIRTVDETPWHLRDHAIFTGYAPSEKPKYAIAVLVEHGGWGGKTTGPIAQKIFTYLLNHLYKPE